MITLLQSNDQLTQTWIVYIILVVIGWAIFYYTIKAAVKNGILAAKEEPTISPVNNKPAVPYTPDQIKLQALYEKGEITFDEYQSEWKKIK